MATQEAHARESCPARCNRSLTDAWQELRRRFPISRFRRVTIADFAQVVLCFVTAFLLLASPVVSYEFKTNDELLLWTCLLAVPAAIIGIVLNHLASAEQRRTGLR